MDKIVDKKLCCGCTSCLNICPKNAISMKTDSDGFKYPVIDPEKCIDCGLCKKVCPILNSKNNDSINECFVAFNKSSEAKKKSSSGAIFELAANYVLNQKGIIIGAAFDDNNKLKHVAIKSRNELDKLKGSKYLQSDLNNIFKFIRDNIKNNKILFVGTPCQVAGLKFFLKKDYDNLICIDLVCHGVPSPKLFEKYISEIEDKYNDKVVNYNFRDKCTGWETYSNTITLINNKVSELSNNNDYMKLFLSDVALRESCYNCNFKLGNKYSDITLGDFWGVKNYYPEMYNEDGVSAIIINSNKGMEIFDSINHELFFLKCNLDEIINGNISLKSSGNIPRNRDAFFKDIDYLSVNELRKKYCKGVSLYRRCLNYFKRIIKRLINK